ncbi:MAG TPA: PAS domain S-box protein [Burkholderiales bacterium]|nr:PAS domain S-box protein [Burkholderiales bacterium]
MNRWLLAGAIGSVSALIVLHFAAGMLAAHKPWLTAVDLVSDALLLVIAIAAVVWQAMRADARAAHARAEVDDAQARLAAVVDSAMDAMISVDEQQRIVLFNRTAEKVFGYSLEQALGMPLERLLPARYRAAHRGYIEHFAHTGTTTRRMGDATVLWGLRADGEEFPIEASISQLNEHGRRFFTVILRDVTLRKQYEDRLKRQKDELRDLSARVQEAREEEKTRIARELHDELGQLLTALKMDLTWLRQRLPEAPESAAKLAQMNALLDQTVGSVRRIAADLRPLMLDDLGFLDAAVWLVEDFSRRSGVQCRIDTPADAELSDLERTVATTLYRALQESLTNIARHAQAKNAWVVIGIESEALRLEIEDDGRGIDGDDLGKLRSLGLRGMRERVQYIGGSLDIGRAPRGGTRVQLRVPLRAGARGLDA